MRNIKPFYLLLVGLLLVLAAACSASADGEEAADPYATIPDNLINEMQIQVAYNETDIFWKLSWASENAGIFHDYLVYTDGEWKRRGDSGGGSDPLGLREDRVLIMMEPGTVSGFANQGCYVGCHDGMVGLNNEVGEEAIAAAGTYWQNDDEVSKYILDSRNGSTWWDGKWQNLKSKEEVAALQEAGVFLDLWHWRAHRSNPIGYSDNQYVLQGRISDGSRSPFKTNFVSDTATPEVMYDPAKVGFTALKWDDLTSGKLTQDDYYYISSDIATEFDPNYAWQNGDTIPRRLLRTPEGAQASIKADGRWENGRWTVVLNRSLAEEFSTVSHPLVEGRTYNAAFAIHTEATGGRWHLISHPYKVGIGTPADINAVRFSGSTPDWQNVPSVSVGLWYPAQTTWDWLTSDAHPGAEEVRADTRSCRSCHGDSEQDVLKLSQASVFHEAEGTGRSANWYLTLLAIITLFGGGTYFVLNTYNTKK